MLFVTTTANGIPANTTKTVTINNKIEAFIPIIEAIHLSLDDIIQVS